MYYDSSIILVFIGMALVLYAQHKVSSTFAKYSEWPTELQITGQDAARAILAENGITDVALEHVPGDLSDHYDARNKVLRLSDATDKATSVAAVAVAAHECGHAVQDAHGYVPLRLRAALVPVTQLGSTIAMPLIFIGFALSMMQLIRLGIFAFAMVLVFQVVTLPVEFDASNRAMKVLEKQGLLTAEELPAARRVLNAAALTYVAATLSTALQLLRFILISRNRD
ncbi:zinc metallopeptidase [Vaginisenegalia massiliensis]|uniref:zinc metallopeptidase n=1 Tax=Vaginisenegalia massiliensis TaxID=2058294 RepID=UPI000F549618|nr:zinc metallopeptidase [Vaginisenegalia massiliensis]